MKKTKTLFWIFTALFAVMMLFSAIPDMLDVPDAIKFMSQLGYPNYLTPFLGTAKLLGVIAILVPGSYPRIKEWAYAGLFFDLTGAVYSIVSANGFHMQMSFMILPFALGILSYVYYHKKIKATA